MDVGFLVFGLAGLLTLVCFMPPLAGRLKLPYSVLLAIVGCLLGIIVHVHGWRPAGSATSWTPWNASRFRPKPS